MNKPTREEIEKSEVGWRIDEWVDLFVMENDPVPQGYWLPDYSSDYENAFKVVDKLQELGHWVEINTTDIKGKYDVSVSVYSDPLYEIRIEWQPLLLAICKVALLTVLGL